MGTKGRIRQAYRPDEKLGWFDYAVIAAWFVSYALLFGMLVYSFLMLLAVAAQ